MAVGFDQTTRRGRAVEIEEPEANDGRIEADASAEHQHQDGREQESDQQRARIAPDLEQLLLHERSHARECARLHDGLPTSAMKASSIVGAGSSDVVARAFSSSGVPIATVLPWLISAMRSQYSASSMKWVVTSTVTPRSTTPLMCVQNSRRVSGSTPEVGSSRKRISGPCSTAAASASRCLRPSGSSPALAFRYAPSSKTA